MATFRDDVRYSLRTLRSAPVFTLTALVTIALGVGAITAIFSVVNAVLLRDLPYAEPDRLALVQSDLTARDVTDFPMAPGDFPDLRNGVSAFEQVAAVTTNRQTVTTDEGTELITVAGVTTNFLQTMGMRVIVGRDFTADDGTAPPPPDPNAAQDAPPQLPPTNVILSHAYWQNRFGGNRDITGTTFQVGPQQTAVIVGVLEPDAELLWPESSRIAVRPDVYAALRIDFATASRVNVFMRVIGRLAPGASIAQAQDQVNNLVMDLRQRFPIKETAGLRWRVEPMHAHLVAPVRPLLMSLLGAVAFVLLIACANVANLMLVRAGQRERELTVRAALGSGRWPLLRQTMVESTVLALAGAIVGVALAWVGIRVLIATGPDNLPRLAHVSLDPTVLFFAFAATMVSALLFGIVPAVRASRVDVAGALRNAGRSGGLSGTGRWLRNAVVVSEVALAFVLLVGSGLMLRSFLAMQRAQPGFVAENTLTFFLPNQNDGVQNFDGARARMQLIRERLGAVPGVTAVSASTALPMNNDLGLLRWGTDAALRDPTLFQQAELRQVQPDYFDVMGTRIVDGRTFATAEMNPDARVVVIDEVLANKAFPGERAVGKRILIRLAAEPEFYEVVGVVQHQRNESPAADGRETLFLPGAAPNRWILRAGTDPMQLVETVRTRLREISPNIVMADVRPLTELVENARATTRFTLLCIAIFALIAALLASIGLYGVQSTAVRTRTAELGMRMALGASARNNFALIVRHGIVLSALGIVAGIIAGLWLTRILATMLVGVQATDPVTFVLMALLFLLIAVIACAIPAGRAARLQPVIALREE